MKTLLLTGKCRPFGKPAPLPGKEDNFNDTVSHNKQLSQYERTIPVQRAAAPMTKNQVALPPRLIYSPRRDTEWNSYLISSGWSWQRLLSCLGESMPCAIPAGTALLLLRQRWSASFVSSFLSFR